MERLELYRFEVRLAQLERAELGVIAIDRNKTSEEIVSVDDIVKEAIRFYLAARPRNGMGCLIRKKP
jgi:hypothetical protein